MDKAEMRQRSRQRAREFAQTLLPDSKLHVGGSTPSDRDSVTQGGGTEDTEEDTDEFFGTRTEGPQNSTTAKKQVMERRTEESLSTTLPVPPMPDFVGSADGCVSKQSSLMSTGDLAESSPLQALRRRRTSFLQHAYTTPSNSSGKSYSRVQEGGNGGSALPETLRSSRESAAGSKPSTVRPGKSLIDRETARVEAAADGKGRRGYEMPSRQSTPRKSFLDVAKIDGGGDNPPRRKNALPMENREKEPVGAVSAGANPLPAAATSNTSRNKERAKFSISEEPRGNIGGEAEEADSPPAASASTISRKQERVKLFSYYAG